jgi:membrane protease YdiL (CAAX protease family)
VAALGAIIPSVWLQEQMPELPNLAEQQFDMIMKDRWGYFAIGILAPVAEELVFRGAVLRALLRWKEDTFKGDRRWAWGMIALSAVFFSLVHGNPAQMPHAFLIGLLLGWMYWRTGSIIPGVAYHWINNSVAYVMYNLYPNPSMKLADLFGGNQQHVLMAVGFSLLILLPALYQLNLWMKRATL